MEAELSPARVPYRETIKKKVEAHGRHKKQTGGSGQFGDVWIRFEPQYESDEMVFAEEVFGGSVPKNFFPAVEKGLREAANKGVLAGYPLVGLKATLYDGSYHPVDSNEMAFKTAAPAGLQGRHRQRQPHHPGTHRCPPGHHPRQLPGRRHGRPEQAPRPRDGHEPHRRRQPDPGGRGPHGRDDALTPSTCALMTQSRGTFTFHFVRYEEAPPAAQQKAIADAKAIQEEG